MKCKPTILAVALLAIAGPAAATEVFRWVDADGVVHFSDTQPEDQDAETLVVRETTPPGYDPAEDPYSILNQAERLAETHARLENEREKREAKRREPIERVVIYEREPDYPYSAYYGPWYPPALPPAVRRVNQRHVAGRQVRALEETGLAEPRPASINSGVHNRRVEQSRALPLAGSRLGH